MNKKPLIITSIGIGTAAAVYLLLELSLSGKFMPGTTINGTDVSFVSRSTANVYLASRQAEGYKLAVTTINGDKSEILGSDIDMKCSYPINDIPEQNSLLWVKYLIQKENYQMESTCSFDEDKLDAQIDEKLLSADMTAPKDAFLTGFVPGEGYMIAPEEDGDTLDSAKTKSAVRMAVESMKPSLDLEEAGCYQKAAVRSDDATLVQEQQKLNASIASSVNYDLNGENVILNADTYYSWLTYNEDGTTTIDNKMVQDYLAELKSATDTAYTKRNFTTVGGHTVELTGPYGFNISKKGEAKQLAEDLISGQAIEREPSYLTVGATRDGSDFGNTYVEIDITGQHVYVVKDGKTIFDTPCVTGNTSLKRGTPSGIYQLAYKAMNVVLRGDNYASPVTYWMPFNNGIGLHDATWRGSFGGSIYKYSGSHGCVNLPKAAAKTIYGIVDKGWPIICYF